jgi:hypothetical protein
MPLIIYSQSPEPIVYYFFTTVLQIYYLRKMLERAGPDLAPGSIIREVQVFSWIALLCFLLNYMSLLISFIVVGYYALFIAGLTKRYNIRRLMLVTREALIDFIPLGILAYLRLQSGDHRVVYYVRGMSGLGRLSYQALTAYAAGEVSRSASLDAAARVAELTESAWLPRHYRWLDQKWKTPLSWRKR